MSTSVPEPGIRLGGRYRLEDRHGAGSGWAAWKATDETLRRAVTVLTFSSGFPRIADTMTAACAASRLNDARLAWVFDMAGDEDHPYVVTEWTGGDSLDDLLAGGPLDPFHAAEIIVQGAEALASAHAAGLAHLCLNPGSIRWTAAGLKIVGLGTDAALAGVIADDPAATDTQALGGLLYGALTARWPGGTWPSLPAAPQAHGRSYRPRQIRAGVPTELDEVCCRVLFPGRRGCRRLTPVATPAQLATALSLAIPARVLTPLPG
jgi:eukaryotic-like serine/threonine-protein kinase